jgi:hypothetical protein
MVILMNTLDMVRKQPARFFHAIGIAACFITALCMPLFSATTVPVDSLAEKETAAFLQTLKELVAIESGSRDREGLDHLSTRIGAHLGALAARGESRATL